jgi:hypothetical protein
VFSVRLTPPLTRSAKELWRLDTAEKYVRGEEALGSWKPRGLSVVEDYNRLIRTERRAADVQAVRAVLAVHPPKPLAPENEAWDKDAVLSRAVDLWKKKFGHAGEVGAGPFQCIFSADCWLDQPHPGSVGDRRLGRLVHHVCRKRFRRLTQA